MKREELTKTFVMISNWRKPFDLYIKNFSALRVKHKHRRLILAGLSGPLCKCVHHKRQQILFNTFRGHFSTGTRSNEVGDGLLRTVSVWLPIQMIHSASGGSMLGRCRKRWIRIQPTFRQLLMFAGYIIYILDNILETFSNNNVFQTVMAIERKKVKKTRNITVWFFIPKE